MGNGVRRFIAVALVSGVVALPDAARATHSDPKPESTTSWYWDNASGAQWNDKGCVYANDVDSGDGPRKGVVVWAMGDPIANGDGETPYGADMFSFPNQSATAIEAAAREWFNGFWRCLSSSNRTDSRVRYYFALGVTNDYPGAWSLSDISSHAFVWANMIDSLNAYLVAQGWSARLAAQGAADIEPDFSSVARARRWVDTYNTYGDFLMWDFGGAAGCAWFGSGIGNSCNNGWTQEDIRYVSWGAALSVPLPEIYRADSRNAEQWVLVSKFGTNQGLSPIGFRGPLTQRQACAQSGCTTNSEATAWNQMVDTMDARPATIYDMDYSTDIKWLHA